jgi:hypothetical protein
MWNLCAINSHTVQHIVPNNARLFMFASFLHGISQRPPKSNEFYKAGWRSYDKRLNPKTLA